MHLVWISYIERILQWPVTMFSIFYSSISSSIQEIWEKDGVLGFFAWVFVLDKALCVNFKYWFADFIINYIIEEECLSICHSVFESHTTHARVPHSRSLPNTTRECSSMAWPPTNNSRWRSGLAWPASKGRFATEPQDISQKDIYLNVLLVLFLLITRFGLIDFA